VSSGLALGSLLRKDVVVPELESALEGFFQKRIRLVGGYSIKLAPTERGIPDRLAIMPVGRMFLVELKAEGGVLSPIQKAFHERMRETGVNVVTLYGRGQIIDWLRHRTNELSGHPVDYFAKVPR
jgi:hypothetical protein